MASEDFKQTGKIKFSDINDLTNNSITTGNIYASGTSANIGTSDNPFNSVYANQYYGRKFMSTVLLTDSMGSLSSYPLSDSVLNYQFLTWCSKWSSDSSWTIITTPNINGIIYNKKNFSNPRGSNYGYIMFNLESNTSLRLTTVSNLSWFILYGLY